jgi:hypothetical protein
MTDALRLCDELVEAAMSHQNLQTVRSNDRLQEAKAAVLAALSSAPASAPREAAAQFGDRPCPHCGATTYEACGICAQPISGCSCGVQEMAEWSEFRHTDDGSRADECGRPRVPEPPRQVCPTCGCLSYQPCDVPAPSAPREALAAKLEAFAMDAVAQCADDDGETLFRAAALLRSPALLDRETLGRVIREYGFSPGRADVIAAFIVEHYARLAAAPTGSGK